MKRIVAIDILRGFAILGILVMNIMSFALPGESYFNPAVFGGDDWLNRTTYALVHIFADQKFMALFSMLFGSSVMLLIRSIERKGGKVARFHYSRNFWLLVIGLLHATLLWDGDVLTVYALCAFVLYFLRNISPKWQFALGLLVFLIPGATYIAGDALVRQMPSAEIEALQAYWIPTDAELAEEIEYYRGDYLTQVAYRAGVVSDESGSSEPTEAIDLYFSISIVEFFVRAFGMMLMGMAFYTWGILTAKRSDEFYWRMVQIGLPLGVLLSAAGVWWNSSAEWEAVQSIFLGRLPNLLATPLTASAYVGLVMLWSRSQLWSGLQDRLAATGRMALTNYIGQTVIGTFIFYGFGLGLHGVLNRWQLLPVVLLIWIIQLWYSPIWLRHFRYGPLEWMWRSLSYWKIQPLRRQPKTAAPAAQS